MANQGKLLDARWRLFAEQTIPVDACQYQHVAMRRAFYAGAWSLMSIFIKIYPKDRPPTAADMRNLHAVLDEIGDFEEQVERGEA